MNKQIETHNALQADLADLGEKLKALKAAFGAPGDYGYSSPEGKALYALYASSGWAAAMRASVAVNTGLARGDI